MVVTCADPRVFPERFLGLRPAEVVVVRSIAGHPAPVLKDMAGLSAAFATSLKEIMIVHHTGGLSPRNKHWPEMAGRLC